MKINFVCARALLCLWLAGLAMGEPASYICSLQGFNLSTLQQASYWKFTVQDKSQCHVPLGNTTDDVISCTINFAICHSLQDGALCSGEDSSICQEVELTNGTVYYDMGAYDPTHSYTVLDGNAVGFSAERTGSDVTVSNCNGTLRSVITFSCDSDVAWYSSHNNVTNHLVSFLNDQADGCLSLITLKYAGACYHAPTLAPNTCQLDDYDIQTLSQKNYWYANVDDSLCLNATSTCRFYFSFCHPVPPEVNSTCYDNGVCQIGDQHGDNPIAYGMGMFRNSTRFYPNVDNVGGGFHVEYENGSAPSNPNCTEHGLRTRIVFICNSSLQWTEPDRSNIIHVTHNKEYDPCMYVFEFQYNGACEAVNPTVQTEAVSVIGWVFIGIKKYQTLHTCTTSIFMFRSVGARFLGLVAVYVVIGSAFRYFVKQERGVRILPHVDFWKAFVIYVLEGCRFFLDCITCFKFDGSTRKVKYDSI